MLLTDTHSHLYAEQFETDREETVQRALDSGIGRIFLPNIDLESIDPMKKLVNQYPENCFPMMGLHPCSVGADVEIVLGKIQAELEAGDYVAVGEIGIDLYWDKTFLEQQQWAFREQIRWAKQKQLPIVIHARDAFEEIFEIVDEEHDENLRGIFHCFTGGEEEVKKIDAYGSFLFGIGGVLTFKKSGLDQVTQHIPMEKLVLETDAPYLAPTPYRGKRNEVSYLMHIAEKLAEVKDTSLTEIAEITTENSKRLFSC